MTLTACPYPAPSLPTRLLAAFDLDAPARRIAALAILHELARARLPMRASTAKLWSAMADLLDRCADELSTGDVERLVYFCDLAQQAHRIAEAVRETIRPSGYAVPMPRSWQPKRVIEMAEVA